MAVPVRSQLLQRLPEGPPVAGGHHDPAQPALPGAEPDVRQHVVVDIGVFGRLGFGEDGETDVAQGLDPGPDHLGAARDDVGEHAGLGHRVRAGQLQQPAADGVEAGPERRGRPGAEQRAEAHVHVRGVPDQQHARARYGSGAAVPTADAVAVVPIGAVM